MRDGKVISAENPLFVRCPFGARSFVSACDDPVSALFTLLFLGNLVPSSSEAEALRLEETARLGGISIVLQLRRRV